MKIPGERSTARRGSLTPPRPPTEGLPGPYSVFERFAFLTGVSRAITMNTGFCLKRGQPPFQTEPRWGRAFLVGEQAVLQSVRRWSIDFWNVLVC